MTEYETIVITNPDLDATALGDLGGRIKEICSNEAHLLDYNDWGVRKLAYEIQKTRKGRYLYINYLAQGKTVAELERNFRFDQNIMRYLTVKMGEVKDIEARIQQAQLKAQKAAAAKANAQKQEEESSSDATAEQA